MRTSCKDLGPSFFRSNGARRRSGTVKGYKCEVTGSIYIHWTMSTKSPLPQSFDPFATHPFTNNSGVMPLPPPPSKYPYPLPSPHNVSSSTTTNYFSLANAAPSQVVPQTAQATLNASSATPLSSKASKSPAPARS